MVCMRDNGGGDTGQSEINTRSGALPSQDYPEIVCGSHFTYSNVHVEPCSNQKKSQQFRVALGSRVAG